MGMGNNSVSRNLYPAVIDLLDLIKGPQRSDALLPTPQKSIPSVRVLSGGNDSAAHRCDGCARCCFDKSFRTP